MNPRSLRILAVVSVLGGGGVITLVMQVGRSSSSIAPPPTSSTSSEPPGPELSPSERSIMLQEDAPLEVVLASFWGDEWVVVKEQYTDASIALDQGISSVDLLAWEEALPGIEAKARQYHERDIEGMTNFFMAKPEENPEEFRENYGIPADVDLQAELADIYVQLAEIDYEIGLLAGEYVAGMDRAMEAAIARGPKRSPLIAGPLGDGTGAFHTTYVTEGGWHAAYELTYKDCPALADIQNSRSPLVSKRMRILSDFANGLRQR